MVAFNSTKHPGNFIDIAGQRFGRLVVLEIASTIRHVIRWKCKCDCGNIRNVVGSSLRSGKTKGCGQCTRVGRSGSQNPMFTHGMRKTPEYIAWRAMLSRCYNKKHIGWKRYGGRGVKVCERWRTDFFAFFSDMGARPTPQHTLDRFPNKNGDYDPSNCRWATMLEQQRNRTDNRMITHNGFTAPLIVWSERVGLSKDTLRKRLEAGWTTADALTRPLRPH